MPDNDPDFREAQPTLREQAETKLRNTATSGLSPFHRDSQTSEVSKTSEVSPYLARPGQARTSEAAQPVQHELQVHQIELELQNEELRRAQAELEESRARYFDLYDLAPVGYVTLSEPGLVLEANLTAAELLGVTRRALVQQPLTRFIHPADQDLYYRYRHRLMESGAPQTSELRLMRPDGTSFWAQLQATALPGAGGAPMCRMVISDITARKQTEAALHESERRFRLALKNAPVTVATQDQDLRFTWAYNQRTVRPTDVIGKTDTEVFPPESAARLMTLKRQVLETGAELQQQLWLDSGSHRVFLDLFLEPIRGEAGQVTGLGIATVDLTAQKRAEEALQARQADLTATNEKLRAQQAALAAINEKLGLQQHELTAINTELHTRTAQLAQSNTRLHRLNRTLAARSHSSRALMQASSETDYLNEVCRSLAEDCGYALAWIGYAEADEAQTVRPVAQAAVEAGDLVALQITWADREHGHGPTGTAIRTGQPSASRNLLTDPHFAAWHAQVLNRGYAAALSLPLMAQGRAFGALTLYFTQPDSCSEDEVILLAGLADDVANGIQTIRLRAAHAQAEAALQAAHADLEKRIAVRTAELAARTHDLQAANIRLQAEIVERQQAEDRLRLNALRSEAIAEISQALAEAKFDYPAALDAVARVTAALFNDACLIVPFSPDRQMLTVEALHHPDPAMEALLRRRLPFAPAQFEAGQITRHILQTDQPLLVPDIPSALGLEWIRPDYRPTAEQVGLQSMLVVPLHAQGRSIGQLLLLRLRPGVPYAAEDQLTVQNLADRAALAITNAQLYRDLEKALAQEQSIRQQLVQAEKLGALGRMVSSVAHEINNPLQTITNCLYLTHEELSADSPIHDYLEMAGAETERLIDLVAQLRELYRPRTISPERCDLVQLIQSVRALLAPQLEKGQVQWLQRANLPRYWVVVIPDRLKQVCINMVTNAIEAMQPGGGRLLVGLVPSADGGQVGVTFKDTGRGIAPEHLSRLFEPFFTTKSQGLGLGLAICYEIVQQHGGHITAESQVGQGTVFTVWLPFATTQEPLGGSTDGAR